MERYTKRSKNGKVYVTNAVNLCFAGRPVQECLFCVGCQGPTDRKKCGPLAIIDRLAAYEDTGLEPEEIVALTVEPPNDPLTLDELREMDGEPVWVRLEHEDLIPINAYGIVNAECECVEGLEYLLKFEDYGVWTAYRRKPEEGET